jgi:membrane-associated phospholipid phosphatase
VFGIPSLYGRAYVALLLLLMTGPAGAQGTPPDPIPVRDQSLAPQKWDVAAKDKSHTSIDRNELPPGEDPENRLILPFIKHLAGDQRQFWTSPLHFQTNDLKWILPGAGLTAAFVASDSWLSKQVPVNHIATSKKISDYTTYSLIGLGGASWVVGHVTHNDHLAETGLLAGEAAINATAVAYAFKGLTQRQRPYMGNGQGSFFAGGNSFPSEHSAIAWSVASVWAHEYPGWFSQIAAYGLASTVSLTRVTARQHFPSDAIIGSILGWYFARQVYRSHHDRELGGSAWGGVFERGTGDTARNPNYMASPYVPLDSWVYPALERLIASGYLQSNVLGMRPWTRLACARLLDNAQEKFPNNGIEEGQAGKIYAALMTEFGTEIGRLDGAGNIGARLESVYTRSMGISGTPLRDGYHFGQTIINDYGNDGGGRGGSRVLVFTRRIPVRACNALVFFGSFGGNRCRRSQPAAGEWNS